MQNQLWRQRRAGALGWLSIVLLLVFAGCRSRIVRLDHEAAYLAIELRTFALLRDGYLVKEADDKNSPVYIGCIAEEPGLRIPYFPDRIDESLIGKRVGGFLILAIVRKGTTFRVVGLKRKETFETAFVSFEIVLGGGHAGSSPIIDGFWLTDSRGDDRPKIYEELAIPTTE